MVFQFARRVGMAIPLVSNKYQKHAGPDWHTVWISLVRNSKEPALNFQWLSCRSWHGDSSLQLTLKMLLFSIGLLKKMQVSRLRG